MLWIDLKAAGARAAIALAAAAIAGSAAAQSLVVRSSGPSAARYRAGTMLRAPQSVELRSGDAVTLLSDGATWTLRGPGVYPVTPGAVRSVSNRAPAAVNQRRERIGAVRSAPGEGTTRPNIWMVDIATPGPTCVVDPTSVSLWRADAMAAAEMTLTGPDGAAVPVSWAAGQSSRSWPAALPVVDGASYRLEAGSAAPVSVTLKTLPAAPASVPDAGAALIAAGCSSQLDLLLAQVGGPSEADGS